MCLCWGNIYVASRLKWHSSFYRGKLLCRLVPCCVVRVRVSLSVCVVCRANVVVVVLFVVVFVVLVVVVAVVVFFVFYFLLLMFVLFFLFSVFFKYIKVKNVPIYIFKDPSYRPFSPLGDVIYFYPCVSSIPETHLQFCPSF